MAKSTKDSVKRRDFLKGSAAGMAALVAGTGVAAATDPAPRPPAAPTPMSKKAETGNPASVA